MSFRCALSARGTAVCDSGVTSERAIGRAAWDRTARTRCRGRRASTWQEWHRPSGKAVAVARAPFSNPKYAQPDGKRRLSFTDASSPTRGPSKYPRLRRGGLLVRRVQFEHEHRAVRKRAGALVGLVRRGVHVDAVERAGPAALRRLGVRQPERRTDEGPRVVALGAHERRAAEHGPVAGCRGASSGHGNGITASASEIVSSEPHQSPSAPASDPRAWRGVPARGTRRLPQSASRPRRRQASAGSVGCGVEQIAGQHAAADGRADQAHREAER